MIQLLTRGPAMTFRETLPMKQNGFSKFSSPDLQMVHIYWAGCVKPGQTMWI